MKARLHKTSHRSICRRRAMSRAEPLPQQVDARSVPDRMEAASGAFARGDYPTALEIWGPLAHAGVTQAQAYVGACFAEGWGVEADFGLAVRWLTLAADAGDPEGQRNLAALYFRGDGVAEDFRRAAKLY